MRIGNEGLQDFAKNILPAWGGVLGRSPGCWPGPRALGDGGGRSVNRKRQVFYDEFCLTHRAPSSAVWPNKNTAARSTPQRRPPAGAPEGTGLRFVLTILSFNIFLFLNIFQGKQTSISLQFCGSSRPFTAHLFFQLVFQETLALLFPQHSNIPFPFIAVYSFLSPSSLDRAVDEPELSVMHP